MDSYTHTCLHCPDTATVTAAFSANLVLPPDWYWWTRRGEGLDAVASCGKCWRKLVPMRTLRRVGGPQGRQARGGTRG